LQTTREYSGELTKVFSKVDALKKKMKKVMEVAATVKADAQLRGRDAFELRVPFDELTLLAQHRDIIFRGLNLTAQFVQQDVNAVDEKEQASPGKPNIRFS
jgi:leucyl-tRNA synthetase